MDGLLNAQVLASLLLSPLVVALQHSVHSVRPIYIYIDRLVPKKCRGHSCSDTTVIHTLAFWLCFGNSGGAALMCNYVLGVVGGARAHACSLLQSD